MGFPQLREVRSIFWPGLGLLFLFVVGCSEEAPLHSPAPPPAVAFEGKVDPAYVGRWVTDSKLSSMELIDDGSVTMENTAPGRGSSKSSGQWKISEDKLLIKMDGPDGQVLKYDVKLDRDTLHMEQKSARLKVDYRRQTSSESAR